MAIFDTHDLKLANRCGRRRGVTAFFACLMTAGLALAFATFADVAPASAQRVVVMVNGAPITTLDVEERMKLVRLTTHKAASREQVINDLIDEKLKLKEAKRWGIVISDAEVDKMFGLMGTRMHVSPEQLTKNLARSGVNAYTLKDRIRADAAWNQLVRGRYKASLEISEKDIEAAMAAENVDPASATAYDYVMRPILLIVPPGSPSSLVERRRKQAEALRERFRGCRDGIAMARHMPDVAVRDQVTRSSGDLSPALRKIVDAIPVGQLSKPEVTKLGIEMFALCEKRKSNADTPAKRKARNAAFAKRFKQQSDTYLRRLRQQALIERR